jgi:D-3-phosphoglycerate dehydrogenase
MRIAVLDDHADAFVISQGAALLHEHETITFGQHLEGDELVAALDGFDAVVLLQQRTSLPRGVVERLTTVRLVCQTGRHTSHLDLDALAEQGITVCTGGSGDASSTVELTWALVLASRRHLVEEANRLASGAWQHTVGHGLAGTTLGVWGLGRIGTRVAEVGRAFGMDVLVWGGEGSRSRAVEAGFRVATDRAALFATSDVLTVHVPLTPATRGMVTGSDLALMRPDALFVNTSRAGLVEPGALAAAVRAGRPGRAAVDVFDVEPVLDAADPLVGLPGALATPHLGYVTHAVLDALYTAMAERILAFDAGEPLDVVR